MKRGEVWWVNFSPSVGGEIQKIRPAVIISINPFNQSSNRVQVVPLTSKVTRVYPSEVLVTFRKQKAKAMADQLATVSKLRLGKKAGELSKADMRAIKQAICLHLGLA